MYSPKISPELVPVLYREAKSRGIPMTRLVDRLLRQSLASQRLCPEAAEALAEGQTFTRFVPPAKAA